MKKLFLAAIFVVSLTATAFSQTDNFESYTAGDMLPLPSDPPLAGEWVDGGSAIVRDDSTGTPFGASNNYLESPAGGPWNFIDHNIADSSVLTASFDFYWDSIDTGNWVRWSVTGDAGGAVNWINVGTAAFRTIVLGADGEGDIETDTAYRVDLVYNFSGATVNYNDGASLGDKQFEVWIDGVNLLDDQAMNRPDAATTTTATRHWFGHNGVNGANGKHYYDNVAFASSAVVTGGATTGLLGDFDGDLDVDLDDLDEYNGNIGASVPPALADLDLDGDLIVGANDFETHYTTLVETSNGQTGTFAGDANLDGVVDVLADAAAVVNNLGVAATSWAQGDFNGDGNVDVLGDAAALINNLGKSNVPAGSPSTSAVPEPGSLSVLALSGLVALMRRKR